MMQQQLERLAGYRRLWVLTGAGCSTASGIPAYRDHLGQWRHGNPIQHREFLADHRTRQRYWARSILGWRHVGGARPNAAHLALARLEQAGRVSQLVTQNVDGLHWLAGQRELVELHGSLHHVHCLGCGAAYPRSGLQSALVAANPGWLESLAPAGPDGDIALADNESHDFTVPACTRCGGILKPDVVFFGDTVPAARVDTALRALRTADAMVAVGSSLMVYSGFRFARAATEWGIPLVIINQGITRADPLAQINIQADCGMALSRLSELLGA